MKNKSSKISKLVKPLHHNVFGGGATFKQHSDCALHYQKSKKSAFTTAEVLIIIVVIGVLAAITIPNLYNKYKERVYVSQLEQTYSDLQRAFIRAQAEQNINTWSWMYYQKPMLKELFKQYDLALISTAYGVNGTTRFSKVNSIYKINYKGLLSKYESTRYWSGYYFLNRSGDMVGNYAINTLYFVKNGPCFYYSSLNYRWLADINGIKGPNTGGIDLFEFTIDKKGVHPVDNCNCQGGYGCTKYVLDNKNMNYLKNCYVPK